MHRLRDLWLLINEFPILFDLLSKRKLAFVVGVKATIKLPSSSKPSEFSQYGCCTGNAVDEFSLSNPASPYMLMSLPWCIEKVKSSSVSIVYLISKVMFGIHPFFKESVNYVVSSWVFVNKKTTHAYSSPPYAKKGQILKEVWPHVFIIKGISTHVEKPKFHRNPWREEAKKNIRTLFNYLGFPFQTKFYFL